MYTNVESSKWGLLELKFHEDESPLHHWSDQSHVHFIHDSHFIYNWKKTFEGL